MKGNQPRVTALVPSYNHGPFIRERIESVINQTYTNLELIVIDDCSTDESDAEIRKLQIEHGFRYLRKNHNSGSPFTAWEQVGRLASGEYIWICESDDAAAPSFLETAVGALLQEPAAVMFYCSSIVIDEDSKQTGHSDHYFHDIWLESRWDSDFVRDGLTELVDFQVRGQTVPNMSSTLISASAFKSAFTPFLKKLKLTGDWLFVGEVMRFGKVIFSRAELNYFREHQVTARIRVDSARSQAEFIITKYRLFRRCGLPVARLAEVMSTDVVRFLYETASLTEVLKSLLQVSWIDTIKLAVLLSVSMASNKAYFAKFRERYKHARGYKIT